MFSKKDERLESFIGKTTEFTGEIRSKGTLRIDGKIDGNLKVDILFVGEKALIKGNIEAKKVIVGGVIEGNLKATDTVEVRQKGKVNGDIVTSKLVVQEGGVINGRTNVQTIEPGKVLEFQKDAPQQKPEKDSLIK